jgi:predicted nucleic acid-binding protein
MPDDGAYIDTSVLGAYYCPEDLSSAAEAALRSVATPVISVLTEIEFGSLISRKKRLGELADRQSRDILALFENHVSEGFYRRIAFGNDKFIKARQLITSMTSSLRTLDALHLAAAMIESLPLMTSDRILAAAARHHKTRVILVK